MSSRFAISVNDRRANLAASFPLRLLVGEPLSFLADVALRTVLSGEADRGRLLGPCSVAIAVARC